MTYCVAFHSYKGGTGKTTIASNLSAYLAKQGKTVVLLDLDLYSPSLQTYFRLIPKKWINDYLYSFADVKEIITDVSPSVFDFDISSNASKLKSTNILPEGHGRFLLGVSNSNMRNISQLDVSGVDNQKYFFRRLVQFRDSVITEFKPDYIILDTSPGIRFWSLNTLAISDMFFLTLKTGDIDIKGTEVMIKEIYNSFIDSGTKSYLLWNKVSGYCTPPSLPLMSNKKEMDKIMNQNQENNYLIENKTDITPFDLDVLESIPCYCDIQFSPREYLTSIYCSDHPFTNKIELLANKIYTESTNY